MDKDIADMMNKFSDMIGNESTDYSSDKPNFDMDTFLKLKSVLEKMNQKDDPRSHLLLSLKPYLKDKRKEKIDQYITLFQMSKVMELLKETGGGKAK